MSGTPIHSARYWARWISISSTKARTTRSIKNLARTYWRGIGGVHGRIAVAPNAQRVSVVGDLNGWDGRVHTMRKMIPAGIWEIFIPGVRENAHYKFEVRGPHGEIFLKTDPFAFYAQHGTQTGCVVFGYRSLHLGRYGVDEEAHPGRSYNSPMSIYEVHLGSWQRHAEEDRPQLHRIGRPSHSLTVKEMGFTHIETRYARGGTSLRWPRGGIRS